MEEANTETTPNCHRCDDSSRIASRRSKTDTMVVAACVYFLLTLERLLLNDDNVIATKTNIDVPAEHFQDIVTTTTIKHDEMTHVGLELIASAMIIECVAFALVICCGTKKRRFRFSMILGLGWISLNLILLMLGSAHSSIFPFEDGGLSRFVQWGTVLVLEVQLMVMLWPKCIRFVSIQGQEEMDDESSAESSASLHQPLLEFEEV